VRKSAIIPKSENLFTDLYRWIMTDNHKRNNTICLPICEDEYKNKVYFPDKFREFLDDSYEKFPELFPITFSNGYELKDHRVSLKTEVMIRRIQLRDKKSYSIYPSFLMPYMAGRTKDVEKPLFLRKFGVPYWALGYVFGKNAMYWYRMEVSLGRNSVVGTTVRKVKVPDNLLADEHHQTRDGEKNYIAVTVGEGCCLGAGVSETAGTEDLTEAYGKFKDEARNIEPEYTVKTVNTDGWKSTQAAWRIMFPLVVVLQCFLHSWLKIRDRAKHLKDKFTVISQKVWNVYHAPDCRSLSQRIRHLRTWANVSLQGIVLEKVLDLCNKRELWKAAYKHPEGRRTSNMLDRVMRSMNRYFFDGQHLHGSHEASELHCRGWALLYNFTPWNPCTSKANGGWNSPAERLNKHRYHDNWLENLLISASLGGYIDAPQNP
jgi:hypothetical protein